MRNRTLRLRLKTGEFYLRKDIKEFFNGRMYFVWVYGDDVSEAYSLDNVLSVEYLSKGEFVKLIPQVINRKKKTT